MNLEPSIGGMKQVFEDLLVVLKEACLEVYRDRLVSLCVFGSVAAGTMRPDSDIDILLVCEQLPHGRMARVREFEAVDRLCEGSLEQALQHGVRTTFSPHIKTPDAVLQGTPVFLDMTHTVRILFDREGFLEGYLETLKNKLTNLGARKVRFGGGVLLDSETGSQTGRGDLPVNMKTLAERQDALRAIEDARFVLDNARLLIKSSSQTGSTG